MRREVWVFKLGVGWVGLFGVVPSFGLWAVERIFACVGSLLLWVFVTLVG